VVSTVFTLWSPEAGNLFYEGTGVLTFLLSVVTLYFKHVSCRGIALADPPPASQPDLSDAVGRIRTRVLSPLERTP
jgi:hypothetical protein